MNVKLLLGLGLALLAAGCGTPSQPHSASVDELLGTTPSVQGGSVFVSGAVRRNVIPWNAGLTLHSAFVLSGYAGPTSGMQISVSRGKDLPINIDLQDFYHGQDLILEPGDRVEIQLKPK